MLNQTRATIALTLIPLFGFSSLALSKLYVSNIAETKAESKAATVQSKKEKGLVITGKGQSGDYVLSEFAPKETATLRFGTNVPLNVAIDKLVPPNSYKAVFDQGLNELLVSWRGGNNWLEILEMIAEQNEIEIYINHADRLIGIAHSVKMATNLASIEPKIWRLKKGQSLRLNLIAWSKKAGWELSWGPEIDYPVNHSATVFGLFDAPDGPIITVLKAFSHDSKPLEAHFYANKVVRVTLAGHRQEISY